MLRVAVIAKCLAVNAGAIFVCDLLLDGFAIYGVWSYVVAAIAIELPDRVFLAVVRLWFGRVMEPMTDAWYVVRLVWAGAAFVLVFVLPLILSTRLPGILLADWLSPNLRIDGAWTYIATSAITMVVLIPFRQLGAFNWAYAFIRAPGMENEQPEST